MAKMKIQDSDIKSAADLISAGGTAAQLPNDTKVYVTANSLNKTLYQAITDGDLSGGGTSTLASPVFHDYGSGSGTYNLPYHFVITSGSATVGATYTNNSVTFTVYKTVSSATRIVLTGSGAPTSSGTLTKASGTGDATLTFSKVLTPLYLRVRMVGGGGGGAGSSTLGASNGGNGGTGGNTTFGTSLLTSNGGGGGAAAGRCAQGGQNTIALPAYGFAIEGARGSVGFLTSGSTTPYLGGADGASTPFGGRGEGATAAGVAGFAAIANSGSGGGGGGGNGGADRTGGGGSAAGYIDAIIPAPLNATYSYSIGAAGTAGTAGTGGFAGGAGAAGYVCVEAYFQ